VKTRRVWRQMPEGLTLAPLRLRSRLPLVIYGSSIAVVLLGVEAYRERARLSPVLEPLERGFESIGPALDAVRPVLGPVVPALEPLQPALKWLERAAEHRWFWIAVHVTTLPLALKNREDQGRTVRGSRIRRVDLRTGGPITVRGALIHFVATIAVDETKQLAKSELKKRRGARIKALYPRLDQLRREHEGDQAGLEAAWAALLAQHRLSTVKAVLLQSIVGEAFRVVPILLTPRHQTLPDLLAGIVTVVDRSEPAT